MFKFFNFFLVASFCLFSLPMMTHSFSVDELCRKEAEVLQFGDKGPAVVELQKFLNSDPDTQVAQFGYGSPGHETEFFGKLTEEALKKFRQKNCNITGQLTPDFESSLNKIKVMYLGNGGFFTFLLALVLAWGFNFIFWGLVGLVRIVTEKIGFVFRYITKKSIKNNEIATQEVAVIVPAHNEELVIGTTLISLSDLVAPENIFVVSDGSKDDTAHIARMYKANVLELNPGKGKAGALETCIKHFEINKKYKAVILVDADTRLKKNYLKMALPYFNDPKVVAVAGYASTIWKPKKMSWWQILFISHRERVYFLSQRLVKFGQTWRYTNVTPIVPGFASTYRTSILNKVDMNPPGLVIEDFNMTFELHHKNLGLIVHHPDVVAFTQDPDNFKDYFRQVKRWHLGFWQTIRFHGFWFSKFWLAMILTLAEIILGSLVFLGLPVLFALSFFNAGLFSGLFFRFFISLWLSDYLLTVLVAIFQKRWHYLVVGPFFPLVRFFDAIAFLSGIPRAFLVKSNGQWVSPTRRAD